MTEKLKIFGARENNLKNVSLEIPHDEFVVVTGISGSGKSSLAFDTVYAEGQRRYIETFSPYTRQFFDKVKRPTVDAIENVRPAIAIQQRTRVVGSRSTVGSMTNIVDYLKVLWAALAVPFCPKCGERIVMWKSAEVAQALLSEPSTKTLLIAAPVDFTNRIFAGEKERLVSLGFSRIWSSKTSEITPLEACSENDLTASKTLLVVLDRIKAGATLKRVRESVEQAFQLSVGRCVVIDPEASQAMQTFSQLPICSNCGTKIAKPRPALFSYNHPLGACPECKGFGKVLSIDPTKVVPNPMLSLKDGAIQAWTGDRARGEMKRLLAFCGEEKISTSIPWRELSPKQQDLIFNHKSRTYRGVNLWFKMLERKAYRMHVRVFLSRYRTQTDCPACQGSRFRADALAYRVDGKAIHQILRLPVSDLLEWLTTVTSEASKRLKFPRQVRDVISSTLARLSTLVELGLPYLTLDRQSRTLSGGETQRVNLTAALGSELTSTHFVLDEPSVGLHPRDTERLIKAVQALHAQGNSVLVVEHDLEIINSAPHIIELGPQAGAHGGQITYSGPRESWPGIDAKIAVPTAFKAREPRGWNQSLKIKNACARNLKNLSFEIPLQALVCLTGVSGSGKSSLITEVIERAAQANAMGVPQESDENLVSGFEHIAHTLLVTQAPLAKSPRANIATYVGVWETVREMLARTPAAVERALSKSAFSFNVDGGRCPVCSGAGFIREDMQFLSDVYIPCEQCLGKRFQESVLEVTLVGKNAHEILSMSIEEAVTFFQDEPSIASAAKTLALLGLGHLTLGHPLSELSGGEAQRLKLVPFVQQGAAATERSLLIFDEPTTGLHAYDIQKLCALFQALVDRGHSVLCVEHNQAVMLAADWLIDLGPEGGELGGNLILAGTPQDFLARRNRENSLTARYLQDFVKNVREGHPGGTATPPARAKPDTTLRIEGAREHNLKDISVGIPLNRVVALTGVSGSGKSSIAKDIIYAEGQRRYLDCLSPYARQFVQELKRPEVDKVINIKPAICVYQHTFQPGKFSTVGTMSEVYNFLRLLYAKVGVQHCPDHPEQTISPLSPEEITTALAALDVTQIRLLASVIKQKKGNHRAVLERAINAEISQVRVDGVFFSPSAVATGPGLEKSKVHSIDYVIAKFNPRTAPRDLVEEAVRQGLSLGGGTLVALTEGKEHIFSTDRTCPVCKRGFYKPDPEDLSFHSKRGRCPSCDGSGVTKKGLPCDECGGTRLNEIGRSIQLGDQSIAELCAKTTPDVRAFLQTFPFNKHDAVITAPILRELISRLDTLSGIGLNYLSLSQECSTLSGGELQRLRLATAMGSPLTGVIYIFDEPSAGLHPKDNELVLARLQGLCERENSVIVIEHDPDSIRAATDVVEVGPGGGSNGGEIVFSGSLEKLIAQGTTATAQALRHLSALPAKPAPALQTLEVKSSGLHTVKPLKTTLPLGQIVTVCGVAGSGKSTLVHGIIAETMGETPTKGGKYSRNGHEIVASCDITRVQYIDQQPIGANSRSTPASYLGIFDEIRKVFASALEAKARGWGPGHFSYNTGTGRCPDCKGLGVIKLEMNFLPDAAVTCETCNGARYRDELFTVVYQGMTISDALKLTFEEARAKFAHHRKILQPVRRACDLGLGYLTLGQPSTTLSGGESQRLKIVTELGNERPGHSLFFLDEPTTGLHKADVRKLMSALRELVVRGNSVILIEHDPDVILESDHVIEMGPGPGSQGGRIVFQGASRDLVLKHPETAWGEIIGRYVQTDGQRPRQEYEAGRV